MKNCRLKEIEVNESEPYNEDLLGRNTTGYILLQLVQSFSKGFVMALNGRWGSGKTTFVKMWQQQMKNEGYETIYYNVWENDYISDPLIGLIAEFKKKTNVAGKEQLTKFTHAISRISFSMVPSLLAIMVKHYTGIDIEGIDTAIKEGSKEAIDLLNKSVENYLEQQESIKEFKNALKDYVNSMNSDKPQKPLVFIIDELDRCKPDFAVKTLERIKHLFSVENIVFVLAIDRVQLGNSIKGYYGSDLLDADDYLRRFIDVTYDLPFRVTNILVENVFNRFELNTIILKEDEQGIEKYDSLLEFVTLMFHNKQLTIRQLEKWILHTRLIINNEYIKEYVSYKTIAFIVYLYCFDFEFYNQLLINDLSAQDLFNHLVHYFQYYKVGVVKDPGHNEVYEVIVEILKMSSVENESIIDQNGRIMLSFNESEVDKDVLLDSINKVKTREIASLGSINYSICEFNCLDEEYSE